MGQRWRLGPLVGGGGGQEVMLVSEHEAELARLRAIEKAAREVEEMWDRDGFYMPGKYTAPIMDRLRSALSKSTETVDDSG